MYRFLKPYNDIQLRYKDDKDNKNYGIIQKIR
nr:MAG TPA: hypothetical protein [Caudoviricetes sp.]